MKKMHYTIAVVSLLLILTGCLGIESTFIPPDVLFQDDFSNTLGGWAEQRDDNGITDYDQGGYRVKVLLPNYDYINTPGISFVDTVVDVDVKKLGGPDENLFGVLCRYQDENNLYSLVIGNDGYYGIVKIFGGRQSLIGTGVLEKSDAINQGDGADNHIRASCVGSNLTLEVNGTQLLSVTDYDLTSGFAGVVAGTFEVAGTDVLFDNFVVRSPPLP